MNRRLAELLSNKRAQRAALLALLWIPALAILVVVREVLLPFLLAFALAYVIAPPIRWLSSKSIQGRQIPRWAAVIALYVVTAVVLFGSGRIFVPQLYKELTRLGGEASAFFQDLSDERIAEKAMELDGWIKRNDLPIHIVTAEDEVEDVDVPIGPAPRPTAVAHPSTTFRVDVVSAAQDLIRDGKRIARDTAVAAFSQLQTIATGLIRFFFAALLVLMLTAFTVADIERITTFIFTVTPVRDRDKLQELLGRIDRGLSGVIRGQLTICLINGVLTLIGLLLLKVKFAFLLASVAAVFSLIPIFGSILSTLPIVVVAMSSGPSTAVLAVLWIVGIHLLEANLLNPKVLGDAAKIHPVLIVLALVIGEHYYGLVGALFAVPLMSIMVTIWKAAQTRAMSLDAEIARSEDASPTAMPITAPSGPRRRMRTTTGG